MDGKKLVDIAGECGFEASAVLDVSTLAFLPEVRAMCAADKCRSYGRSWSCPPACGSLEELRAKCSAYTDGVLVQTVGKREDEWDFQGIIDAEKLHKQRFEELVDRLRALDSDFIAMGAGACMICRECTYPSEPCRFPERVFPSMEACGLLVGKLCTDNGLKYYYGKDSISFTSCVLTK